MNYAMLEELRTENLILRKFRYEDVEDFYERVGGNGRVTKYMLWKTHGSLEETQKSMQKVLRRYEEGRCYTWAIALESHDSVIGRIDLLRFNEEESSCSFAYMLGDAYWGKGFGSEALSAVLKFAFEKMEMQTVVADHMSENKVSGAVMKKVGMKYVKTDTAKYEKDGKVYNADEYRISYDEWKTIVRK